MNEHGDILVVGGGPVGTALALGLERRGCAVTLLEARPVGGEDDARTLALSHGSRLLLERLGVWPLSPPATPIMEINVTQRGGFGRVVLTAAEAAVPALGYVVEYSALQRALGAALAHSRVRVETGCAALDIGGDAHEARVTVSQDGAQRELRGALAVVADGGGALAPAPGERRDYGQSALVCDVASAEPHRHRAFERFTAEGPLALLPNARGWALVWTTTPARAAALAALDESDFCGQLREAVGPALGAFNLRGPRHVFPLQLRVAATMTTPRCVLIGNAAQTLHPVAGQGFNLGLRDAHELARLIALHGMADAGAQQVLAAFLAKRRVDRGATIFFTDTLIRLFSNDIPQVSALRALGLAALASLPPARKFVARRMIFGARG